jgi:hypothetical protein
MSFDRGMSFDRTLGFDGRMGLDRRSGLNGSRGYDRSVGFDRRVGFGRWWQRRRSDWRFFLSGQPRRLAASFRLIENAGDGGQRIVGRVALAHNSASG